MATPSALRSPEADAELAPLEPPEIQIPPRRRWAVETSQGGAQEHRPGAQLVPMLSRGPHAPLLPDRAQLPSPPSSSPDKVDGPAVAMGRSYPRALTGGREKVHQGVRGPRRSRLARRRSFREGMRMHAYDGALMKERSGTPDFLAENALGTAEPRKLGAVLARHTSSAYPGHEPFVLTRGSVGLAGIVSEGRAMQGAHVLEGGNVATAARASQSSWEIRGPLLRGMSTGSWLNSPLVDSGSDEEAQCTKPTADLLYFIAGTDQGQRIGQGLAGQDRKLGPSELRDQPEALQGGPSASASPWLQAPTQTAGRTHVEAALPGSRMHSRTQSRFLYRPSSGGSGPLRHALPRSSRFSTWVPHSERLDARGCSDLDDEAKDDAYSEDYWDDLASGSSSEQQEPASRWRSRSVVDGKAAGILEPSRPELGQKDLTPHEWVEHVVAKAHSQGQKQHAGRDRAAEERGLKLGTGLAEGSTARSGQAELLHPDAIRYAQTQPSTAPAEAETCKPVVLTLPYPRNLASASEPCLLDNQRRSSSAGGSGQGNAPVHDSRTSACIQPLQDDEPSSSTPPSSFSPRLYINNKWKHLQEARPISLLSSQKAVVHSKSEPRILPPRLPRPWSPKSTPLSTCFSHESLTRNCMLTSAGMSDPEARAAPAVRSMFARLRVSPEDYAGEAGMQAAVSSPMRHIGGSLEAEQPPALASRGCFYPVMGPPSAIMAHQLTSGAYTGSQQMSQSPRLHLSGLSPCIGPQLMCFGSRSWGEQEGPGSAPESGSLRRACSTEARVASSRGSRRSCAPQSQPPSRQLSLHDLVASHKHREQLQKETGAAESNTETESDSTWLRDVIAGMKERLQRNEKPASFQIRQSAKAPAVEPPSSFPIDSIDFDGNALESRAAAAASVRRGCSQQAEEPRKRQSSNYDESSPMNSPSTARDGGPILASPHMRHLLASAPFSAVFGSVRRRPPKRTQHLRSARRKDSSFQD